MKQSTISKEHILTLIFSIFLVASCDQPLKGKLSNQLAPSLFRIMSEAEDLNITLQTDFKPFIANKDLEGKNFQPATIIAKDNQKPIYNGRLMIRPRGITRRANCSFPPIMFKTKKKEIQNQNLGPTFNIKLVTHCEDSVSYNQWALKEFLIYKMLNILSKESFEVQKAKTTYQDTQNEFSTITKMGFIIEPLEELSNRCNCEVLDDETEIKNIHKEHYKLITLFQFMIGNTDWNLSRRHNIRLLNCYPEYGPTPVPYDFDYSGFVNASYAKPHPMLSLDKVTDRMLQWRGDVNEDFSTTVAIFTKNKPAFISLIEEEAGLSDEEREYSLLYLEEFYEITSSSDSIKAEIIKARSK